MIQVQPVLLLAWIPIRQLSDKILQRPPLCFREIRDKVYSVEIGLQRRRNSFLQFCFAWKRTGNCSTLFPKTEAGQYIKATCRRMKRICKTDLRLSSFCLYWPCYIFFNTYSATLGNRYAVTHVYSGGRGGRRPMWIRDGPKILCS